MDQWVADVDLTVTVHRWLPGDDQPGTAVELHGRCPVCRQSWSACRLGGPCQLMGVMGGYNAALRNSLSRLMMVWPDPVFKN